MSFSTHARAVKIAAAVLLVIAALLLAGGGALYWGGAPILAWLLEHPLSRAAGRQITLSGPLTLSWGRPSRFIAEDVHVANADWGSAPDFFAAKRLEIDFEPLSLLIGSARVPVVRLDGGSLLLEIGKDGQPNWNFLMGNPIPTRRAQFPQIEQFVVHDSRFVYHNAENQTHTELGIAALTLDEPASGAAVEITGEGTLQKRALRVTGTLGSVQQLRDATTQYPVDLVGRLADTDLKAAGTLAEPLDFNGLDLRLSFTGKRFDDLTEVLGMPMPAMPDFRGTAVLKGGDGKYILESLSLKLDRSDLEGGIAIDVTGTRPYIEANLESSYLDLANFKGVYGGNPKGTIAPKPAAPDVGVKVIPNSRIEIEKLGGFNADLHYYGTRIAQPGGLALEQIVLMLHLKDGTMSLRPLRFHAADGDVDLNADYKSVKDGAQHFTGKIDIRHVDLHKLLSGSTYPEMVRATAGTAGGFLDIDSSGTSPREILARMNGNGGIFLQNGRLSELLQALANLDVMKTLGLYATGSDQPLPINCFVAHFDVKDGIATSSTFLLDTTETTITASGNLDFRNEAIDLTLVPRNKNPSLLALHSPLRVLGTFAHPNFSIVSGELAVRAGAAVGLAVLFPPAALLPLINVGLGDRNACASVYGPARPQQARRPVAQPLQSGQ
ncbi:MAG TPA: AsmA family protein [Stellaceae bacterium]|nr:AsmA family protein [Stellaceae bacterium]